MERCWKQLTTKICCLHVCTPEDTANNCSVPKEALPPSAETDLWQLTSRSHLKNPYPSTPDPHFFKARWSQLVYSFRILVVCFCMFCSVLQSEFSFTNPNSAASSVKQRGPFLDYQSDCLVLLSSDPILTVLYSDSLLPFLIN